MTKPASQREPGAGEHGTGEHSAGEPPERTAVAGFQISADTISGGQFQAGHHNVFNQTSAPAVTPPSPATPPDGYPAGSPVSSLYAFADIVGYSRLNVSQQEDSQDRFARILDHSLTEAGILPAAVMTQNQGDARFLGFAADTDAARILAVMPRQFHADLRVRNNDLAAHARLRVRLSFAMGPAVPGKTGLAGEAPVTVVRLSNSAIFRRAIQAVPQAHLGVIMDDYLFRQYVRQGFRSDLNPEDYLPVQVSDPEKHFEAAAWIRIPGCSPQRLRPLIS